LEDTEGIHRVCIKTEVSRRFARLG
jgi:hypothetical protein